jgi:hypothetical protein
VQNLYVPCDAVQRGDNTPSGRKRRQVNTPYFMREGRSEFYITAKKLCSKNYIEVQEAKYLNPL